MNQLDKERIRTMVLGTGFIRERILAPFEPEQYSRFPIPEQYRNGSPSLLVTALVYGNQHRAIQTIAPFAQRNYYREAVKRLQQLAKEFRSSYGGAKSDFRILCNSPVPEKPLAIASGLGSLGRNSLVITPEAGSLIIIAAMTLPFTLEGDRPETRADPFPCCQDCDHLYPPCVTACPTGAVRGDGTLNLNRCIQWYASGKGETIPPEVAHRWGNRLYGCTDCQDACIHNQIPIQGVACVAGTLPAYLDPKKILAMTDEELKTYVKGTGLGLSWLGPQGIRRNAQMILAQQNHE